MNQSRRTTSESGLSLIEVMVAMTIGLIGIVIIMQVFVLFQNNKRTTASGAEAQENALVALHTIERDGRMAGMGFIGLGCTTVQAYNVNMSTPAYTFSALPATITQDSPAVGTDSLTIRYGTSAFTQIPTKLSVAAGNSDANPLTFDWGDGFNQGNMFVISEGAKTCAMIQASATATKAGASWNVSHNPSGAYPYNPPVGTNVFPGGGYGIGANVYNLGTMVQRQYFVQNSKLMMRDVNAPDVAGSNPIALVDNVYAMKAQYGRDTSGVPDGYLDVYDNTAPASADRLVALRVAIVVRSTNLETTNVTASPLVLWSGGTTANGGAITIPASDQKYRFRAYTTIVPLRNVIWNN